MKSRQQWRDFLLQVFRIMPIFAIANAKICNINMRHNKDKNIDKKQHDYTMIMIWIIMGIIVAAVACCVVGFFCPIFKYPNEDNLVITFLGALAAFVVISNFALMMEIRNKTENKIKEFENRLEAMNTTIDDKVYVTDTDKENIKNMYMAIEKIVFCDHGVLFRYYAIKDTSGYKMLKVTGYSKEGINEIEFKEYLRRFSDDMKESEKEKLKNFGVPINLLNG